MSDSEIAVDSVSTGGRAVIQTPASGPSALSSAFGPQERGMYSNKGFPHHSPTLHLLAFLHDSYRARLAFTGVYDFSNPAVELFDHGLGKRKTKPFRKTNCFEDSQPCKQKWQI